MGSVARSDGRSVWADRGGGSWGQVKNCSAGGGLEGVLAAPWMKGWSSPRMWGLLL